MIVFLTLTALAADADPFRPAGSLASGLGTLQGESPYVLGSGFGFGVLGSFAQDLAIAQSEGRDRALVSAALPVELYAAYTLKNSRARFEIFAPLYAYVESPVNDFQGPALGDLRLQANVPLLELSKSFRIGLVPRVELPTGTARAVTKRGFQVGLTTALGGSLPLNLGWVTNVGLTISEASELEGLGMGSTIDLLAGGWWNIQHNLRLGAEVEAQVGLVRRSAGANTLGTWSVYAQPRLHQGVALTVGVGTGLIGGVGAPDYRMFGALTFQPTTRDRDRDGIIDSADPCPLDPEDFDQFEDDDGCPDVDNDNDTFIDSRDHCPDQAEDFDQFEDDDGCPDVDNDRDGVPDTEDLCPVEPGPAENKGCPDQDRDGDTVQDAADMCPDVPGLVELHGCPDADGDGVPDPRDQCPNDPISEGEDPSTSDGCPKIAFVSGDSIQITQRVFFETGKAVLLQQSTEVLSAVTEIMLDHGEIRSLEVGGHTDNVGSDHYNQTLSQQRADAVRSWMIEHGVSRNRVKAKGYGESEPRDTNRTEAGRTNNRRVEFRILVQESATEEPPAASPWGAHTDPPATDDTWSKNEVELSDVEDPWDTSSPPGLLTIRLRGISSALVYIDDVLLDQKAPLQSLPLQAGPHRVWVFDANSALDVTTDILVHSDESLLIELP